MLTYQDYKEYTGTQADFLKKAINEYISSDLYKTACIADEYDKRKNVTINNVIQFLYTFDGAKVENFTASNNKIASNFFNRLNTQRCTYSLGNGISFNDSSVKDKFGEKLDTTVQEAGYHSLIHGVSYLYLGDRVYNFKATEVVPLYDEFTGALRAAIRFWKLSEKKPLTIVFFEKDGYTEYAENKENVLEIKQEKRSYIIKTAYTQAFGTKIVGEENYSDLPIVPLWGGRLKQSTLVGMREAIDSYDLILSGFANDLRDCAQIYWIVAGAGGANDTELRQFRDRLLLNHIAATSSEEVTATPYTQEIPHQARQEFLQAIRAEIYEGFGGLDVHTIAAGATNDHIDAAYQPLDENADDFEKQIIEAVQSLGKLLDIDSEKCIPIFKRNRISNQAEQVDMVMQAAQYLDDETLLSKLPFLTVDEIKDILKRKAAEEQAKIVDMRAELEELKAEREQIDKSEEMTDGQSA